MKKSFLSGLLLSSSILAFAGPSAFAQEQAEDAEARQEVVFVVGDRRAYQGNFEFLEETAINQVIGDELLGRCGCLYT